MNRAGFTGIVALAGLVACADRDTAGATGGTVVFTVAAGWSPTPPPLIIELLPKQVADLMYEKLAEIGPGLNTVGDVGFEARLARAWLWAPDSLSIAFSIDPRARWHDGRPVRAADVKFTFDLIRDARTASGIAPLLASVDSVTVRDSLTAVAWYRQRTPTQFYDLVYQLQVMPEHVWRDVPRDQLATAAVARAPVGSGRFRFSRFEPGARFELVADTANFRGRARLDRLIWTSVPDIGTAITQLLSGQADVLELVPPDVIARVDSSATLKAVNYSALQFGFMGLNNRDQRNRAAPHPILGDVRVRRALSMALDLRSMLTNVFGERGIIGAGPYPAALADTGVRLLPFDRARAAALLDSAGWDLGANGVRRKGGRPLILGMIVPTSSRPRMRYAVLIQEQLKAVGITVNIEAMEFPAFRERQSQGRFDLAMMSTGFDPTAASYRQAWATSGIGGGGQNFVAYSNRTFDARLDSALMTFDAGRSRALIRSAVQALVDDAPGVWLYDVPTVAGMHRRIQPEGMRADGWCANLADWWIPAGERIERDRIGLRPSP